MHRFVAHGQGPAGHGRAERSVHCRPGDAAGVARIGPLQPFVQHAMPPAARITA
ncbi:hypothetical protein ISF6_1223 [Piscinibacter sakaiensis]|uniref:Uncharacterized protein n=1 Tax=Piscinibacter sakaiensis TaxID=1547922 RepID=A0A0K8NZU4_PISS1|nr:hypothetical protein ISF6_1223 [Piscinibacter sakaiensis]